MYALPSIYLCLNVAILSWNSNYYSAQTITKFSIKVNLKYCLQTCPRIPLHYSIIASLNLIKSLKGNTKRLENIWRENRKQPNCTDFHSVATCPCNDCSSVGWLQSGGLFTLTHSHSSLLPHALTDHPLIEIFGGNKKRDERTWDKIYCHTFHANGPILTLPPIRFRPSEMLLT